MASDTQQEVLKSFKKASGGIASDSAAIDTASAMRPDVNAAATPAGQNVEGGSRTETQGSGGSTAGSVISDVFESGLGVVPLVGELLGLFGGGSDSQPQLLKYQMPSSISFTSAETGDGLSAAGYDQMGLPRVYDAGDSVGAAGPVADNSNSGGASTAPQITVSVQAMDAQSFLDHSSDIAQAVRSAMLSMSSINDVVNEL